MSRPRALLIPWLREKINSGNYPGVHWVNEDCTEFCIPWKHALRQDYSDTDLLIFKAWAEVSGNGTAQGEPAVWKRNFRSALRAKGFKMVVDNKNDTANPHKVFRWPEEAAVVRAGSSDQDDCDFLEELALPVQETQAPLCFEDNLCLQEEEIFIGESNPDILQQCLKGLNIGPDTEDTAGFKPPPEQQQLQNQVVIGGQALPGQQQYPVTSEVAAGEAGLPEQPPHPIDRAVGGACNGGLAMHFLNTINETNDGDHFSTHFRVSVFYRGKKVSEQLVKNEAGIRLVYRPELSEPILDMESGLSLVSLPSPGDMLDQAQARLTQCILDKMGGGLDVGVSGHVIYGQRRGEIKGFWSFSKFDSGTEPQEISKQPQPLYLFRDFVKGILEFIEGNECLPCSLFLCLGEKWPDTRPWEKKLITVEVVLTSMEMLKNMAVDGGASSLKSVELQMSLEEMMEIC